MAGPVHAVSDDHLSALRQAFDEAREDLESIVRSGRRPHRFVKSVAMGRRSKLERAGDIANSTAVDCMELSKEVFARKSAATEN